MSFLVVVEQDLEADATAALAAAKVGLNYIDNVVTTDILPELLSAFQAAISKLGQEGVTALLAAVETPPVA